MTAQVDSIIESFPNPRVPPLVGRPEHASLNELKQLLYENAASVQSALGGGAHGHLGLLISNARHFTLTGENFVPPLNPGSTPNIPNGSTGPQIARIVETHKAELKVFQTFRNVDNALKQQLTSAVPRMYIKALADRMLGFANRTTRHLLVHLTTTYGKLTPGQLELNDKAFKSDYDTNDPIENLYEQIENTTDTAEEAGVPYSQGQILNNALNILTRTGMFLDAIRAWRRRPPVEHTWPNYKLHFTDAADELRETRATAQEMGYSQRQHQANNAETDEHEDGVAMTAEALVNLASATQADRQMLADLSATNTALAAAVTTQQAEITELKAQLAARTGTRNPAGGTSAPRSYCWTHGFYPHPRGHSSQACNRPAEGHKRNANWSNNHGGSQRNKPE